MLLFDNIPINFDNNPINFNNYDLYINKFLIFIKNTNQTLNLFIGCFTML